MAPPARGAQAQDAGWGRRLGLRPQATRARSWLDVVLVLWLAWIFDAINSLAPVRQRLAERHAQWVLDLERSLHAAVELGLNTWLAAHHLMRDIVVFFYENVHGGVTFSLIAFLWWRRPDSWPALRTTLVLVNVLALAVFWSFPVAPPRMVLGGGFSDLVAVVHGQGATWAPGAIAAQSNQLSALPSLHIAWAAWVTLALWRVTPRRWLRAGALVYPLLTTVAVMATANHFLADALTGAALTGLGALAANALETRRHRREPTLTEPAQAGTPGRQATAVGESLI